MTPSTKFLVPLYEQSLSLIKDRYFMKHIRENRISQSQNTRPKKKRNEKNYRKEYNLFLLKSSL